MEFFRNTYNLIGTKITDEFFEKGKGKHKLKHLLIQLGKSFYEPVTNDERKNQLSIVFSQEKMEFLFHKLVNSYPAVWKRDILGFLNLLVSKLDYFSESDAKKITNSFFLAFMHQLSAEFPEVYIAVSISEIQNRIEQSDFSDSIPIVRSNLDILPAVEISSEVPISQEPTDIPINEGEVDWTLNNIPADILLKSNDSSSIEEGIGRIVNQWEKEKESFPGNLALSYEKASALWYNTKLLLPDALLKSGIQSEELLHFAALYFWRWEKAFYPIELHDLRILHEIWEQISELDLNNAEIAEDWVFTGAKLLECYREKNDEVSWKRVRYQFTKENATSETNFQAILWFEDRKR